MPLWGRAPSMIAGTFISEFQRKQQAAEREMERQRKLEEEEAERQREQEEIKNMLRQYGYEVPAGDISPQLVPSLITQQGQKRREKIRKEERQEDIGIERDKQLYEEERFHREYPIKQAGELEKIEKRQEVRPPPRPQTPTITSTVLNEIRGELSKAFYQEAKTNQVSRGEQWATDINMSDPMSVYENLNNEQKNSWDTMKKKYVQKYLSSGWGGMYNAQPASPATQPPPAPQAGIQGYTDFGPQVGAMPQMKPQTQMPMPSTQQQIPLDMGGIEIKESEIVEYYTDPKTGKLMARTKDGRTAEVISR